MARTPVVRLTVSLPVQTSDALTDLHEASNSKSTNQTTVDLITIGLIAVSEQFGGDLAAAVASYQSSAVPIARAVPPPHEE